MTDWKVRIRNCAIGMPAMAACLFAVPAFAQAANPGCPTAAPPVTVIQANAFYKKGTVERDGALFEKNRAGLKPIFDFQNAIARNSDAFVMQGSKAAKACADTLMLGWAKRNALTGFGAGIRQRDYQSHFVQHWTAASLGLARIKLGPLASSADDRIVREWLKRLALSVRDFHTRVTNRNNMFDWAVLTVGSIGYATRDRALVADADSMFQLALNQVQDKGFLPLEMKRGRRAASYHAFAAQPLALYQLIRTQCGGNRAQQPKLTSLINLVRTLQTDPNSIQSQANVAQSPIGKQPWLNVWDSVNGRASREQPSSSRYIAGNSQSLAKALSGRCPAIS